MSESDRAHPGPDDLAGLDPKRRSRIKPPPRPTISAPAAAPDDSEEGRPNEAAPEPTEGRGPDTDEGDTAGAVKPPVGEQPRAESPTSQATTRPFDPTARKRRTSVALPPAAAQELAEHARRRQMSQTELLLEAAAAHGASLPAPPQPTHPLQRPKQPSTPRGRQTVSAYLAPHETAEIDRLAQQSGRSRSAFLYEVLTRHLSLDSHSTHHPAGSST